MTDTQMDPPGIEGYEKVVARFIEVSEKVDFDCLYAHLATLWPEPPAHVLDIGAGSGRDAAALAARGYAVTAVEPTPGFLDAAQTLHPAQNITWYADSLPNLARLSGTVFDCILCQAVWQHLDDEERGIALQRITTLLKPDGLFALSLRHGPPGAGTRIFPANSNHLIKQADALGLALVVHKANQPSAIPGKNQVTWTKLAFRKKI